MAKKIQRITTRDREALRAMACTGYVSSKDLSKFCDVKNERINKLISSGLVERKTGLIGKEKSFSSAYKLTRSGRDYVKENLGIQHPYTCQSFKHDLALSSEYFARYEDRQYWVTEYQQKLIFEEQHRGRYDMLEELRNTKTGLYSPCDGAIIRPDGYAEMIEVITRNYSDVQIQAKQNFAESLGGSYSQVKA